MPINHALIYFKDQTDENRAALTRQMQRISSRRKETGEVVLDLRKEVTECPTPERGKVYELHLRLPDGTTAIIDSADTFDGLANRLPLWDYFIVDAGLIDRCLVKNLRVERNELRARVKSRERDTHLSVQHSTD